jgi:hypothetical protein
VRVRHPVVILVQTFQLAVNATHANPTSVTAAGNDEQEYPAKVIRDGDDALYHHATSFVSS